ncbi:MtnX-like HAD-IB family phosphatase [Candidatus Latescibacterota bacterium]
MKPHIQLFVDFDGTVTTQDIGSNIFSRFMRTDLPEGESYEALIGDWKAGYLSSVECLTRECALTVVTESELKKNIDTYDLTPGFPETACYCTSRGIPLTILSDGMDYYIKYILDRHGYGDIPFFSNRMWFENGGLVCDFPYLDRGCGRCGNCKRHHINRLRRTGDHVVYAGDGYSDRFAIKSADKIFARGDLAEYCCSTDTDFHLFEDFFDILKYIEELHDDL